METSTLVNKVHSIMAVLDKMLADNHKKHVQVLTKPIRRNGEMTFMFKFLSCDIDGCRPVNIKSLVESNLCESLEYVSETKTTLTYIM